MLSSTATPQPRRKRPAAGDVRQGTPPAAAAGVYVGRDGPPVRRVGISRPQRVGGAEGDRVEVEATGELVHLRLDGEQDSAPP